MLLLELIIIQAVTFLGLIILLKKVLYKQLKKAMARLEILREDTERKRIELQSKLEENERSLQIKVRESEERAAKIYEDAERVAEETRASVLAEAKREARMFLDEARLKQEEFKRELEGTLMERAARLAGDALRFIFTARRDQVLHRELTGDLIEELQKIDPKRLDGQINEAIVVMPYALEESDKEKLELLLENKVQKKIRVVGEVDRSLIAGMVIKFENLILDGSLKTKLKEAMGYVRKAEKKGA